MNNTINGRRIVGYLLLIVSCIIILPLIGIGEITPHEKEIQQLALSFKNTGISHIFDLDLSQLSTNVYAYIVNLLYNITNSSDTFFLRFPSAFIVILLTYMLYGFVGHYKSVSLAFLASLLFLSCYFVERVTYQTSPILITSALFITSLIYMYYWITLSLKSDMWKFCIAFAITLLFSGYMAMLLLLFIGIPYLYFYNLPYKKYYILPAILLLSAFISFLVGFVISNNVKLTLDILFTARITTDISTNAGVFLTFVRNIVLSIFPWSVPVIISFIILLFHPWHIKEGIKDLAPYEAYGALIFIVSIPFIMFQNHWTFILLFCTVLFCIPFISRYLLTLLSQVPLVWRVTGYTFAIIIVSIVCIFVYLKSGYTLYIDNMSIYIASGWDIWSILILLAILWSTYYLYRNKRCYTENHRYLYTIIILYILLVILYVSKILYDVSIDIGNTIPLMKIN